MAPQFVLPITKTQLDVRVEEAHVMPIIHQVMGMQRVQTAWHNELHKYAPTVLVDCIAPIYKFNMTNAFTLSLIMQSLGKVFR